MSNICRVGFGGGCHWCTEAVFMTLSGVSTVQQGFIRSDFPNDAFSEAVIVTFDSELVSLEQLIDVHLRTHASTSKHSFREKYRSAIYTFDDDQRRHCETYLQKLQQQFEQPLITSVMNYVDFQSSDEKYRNYYYRDQDRPFCRTYIEPKMLVLRKYFSSLLRNP